MSRAMPPDPTAASHLSRATQESHSAHEPKTHANAPRHDDASRVTSSPDDEHRSARPVDAQTAERIDELVAWARRTYPRFSHVAVGRSGAALLEAALANEPRTTLVLPGFTCASLAATLKRTGKRLLHVDVDRTTLHMRPELLEATLRELDPHDVVVFVDHAFGHPDTNLTTLHARYPGIRIVEDNVRGLGARVDGEDVGRHGDWLLLSLYKTVTASDHGAVLLTPDPFPPHEGPVAALTMRQRLASSRALRVVYDLYKRRHFDATETPRGLPPMRVDPEYGLPNALCVERFLAEARELEARRARRIAAARQIEGALSEIPAVRLLRKDPRGESAGHYVTFLWEHRHTSRNAMVGALHAEGLFLLRTWDNPPARYADMEPTYLHGAEETHYLAEHVAHVPIEFFDTKQKIDRLARALRRQ
jgi:dTDP-4-amino-4,6-dideoxygalactose transaminase